MTEAVWCVNPFVPSGTTHPATLPVGARSA